jgi:hypothetical protein
MPTPKPRLACPLRPTAKTAGVLGRERRVFRQGRSEVVVISVRSARDLDKRAERLRKKC